MRERDRERESDVIFNSVQLFYRKCYKISGNKKDNNKFKKF